MAEQPQDRTGSLHGPCQAVPWAEITLPPASPCAHLGKLLYAAHLAGDSGVLVAQMQGVQQAQQRGALLQVKPEAGDGGV